MVNYAKLAKASIIFRSMWCLPLVSYLCLSAVSYPTAIDGAIGAENSLA